MRVILAGTPSIAIPIFEAVFESDIQVVGVITNPPKSQGRSKELISSPISQWAKERKLEVFEDGNLLKLKSLLADVDLVLVVAFGQLVPEELLTIPKYGWCNIHFSHLPEARGAAPVQRLIAAGAKQIGYTLFRLERGMDTGPIFFRSEPVSVVGLTTGEVWSLLTAQAAQEIAGLLHSVISGLTPTPQEDYSGPLALAPKISTAEARIRWEDAATQVIAKIRAFNPAPSAWTTFRGERFIIHKADVFEPDSGQPNIQISEGAQPGDLFIHIDSVIVETGSGLVRLIEIQQSGKRRMLSADWLRGINLHAAERFE